MLRAIHFPDQAEFNQAALPGSLHFIPILPSEPTQTLLYFCPCGCGHQGALLVGNATKPSLSPSWSWNGSLTEPTLSPSVNHVGHWHGWLKSGYWTEA